MQQSQGAQGPASGPIVTDDMRRVIPEQRLGYVATVCPDETPNLSPKGTVAVWDDRHLVFADLRSPRTIRNLRANPAVEINVVDPISRTGYRFKGEGTVVTDGPVFQQAVSFFAADGVADPDRRIRAVVIVAVQHAAPLVSPAYDLGLQEQKIRRRWQRHYQALWQDHGPPEAL
jgi:uncharacterized protein